MQNKNIVHVQNNITITRFQYFILIILTIFFLISCYLYHLQINLKEFYAELGEKNFQRYEKIHSLRGNIVDLHGNLLATNQQIYTIWWNGTGKKKLTNKQLEAINHLKEIINLPNNINNFIEQAEKKSQKILIANNISLKKISIIEEKFSSNKNIETKKNFIRFYPYNSIASHIIGYLGLEPESSGKMGLELICNDRLKGIPGQIIKKINSRGYNIDNNEIKKAIHGNTIRITLDLQLQTIVEKIFPNNYEGACIILDPKTGAIETLISRPSFNPNMFLKSLNYKTWLDIQTKKCFLNRAFNASYPPASIFKLVTLTAALEEGLITKDTKWNCKGQITFGNRIYHCAKLTGHGIIDVNQALAYSCNIPFYDIAQKIDINTLANYAYKLGFGQKTNVIFSEYEGIIPTLSWKLQKAGERWWPGETLSACIGQSYILVTPIQVARTISAIGTGYFVKPRILIDEPIIKNQLLIKNQTLKFLKNSMKVVTSIGTAKNLSNLKNFKIYAKTGTAQIRNLNKKKFDKIHQPHAWFAAYFKYKNFEPKTIVILIEHAGTTRPVMKFAELFFKEFQNLKK